MIKKSLIVAALMASVVAFFSWSPGAPNGLRRQSSNAEGRVLYSLEYWPWAYLDSVSFGYPDLIAARSIELTGNVWQGGPGQARWRLTHAGGVEVRVDGESVFSAPEKRKPGSGLAQDEFSVVWSGASPALEIRCDVTTMEANAFGHYVVELEEQLAGGTWRGLPEERLYPVAPEPDAARSDGRRASLFRISRRAATALWAFIAALAFAAAARRRPALFAVSAAVFAVALLVRGLSLLERAGADPSLWALAKQMDNYLMFARAELAGFGSPPLFSPGTTWWMVALMEIVGKELPLLFASSAIATSLGLGALAYGTGRLFGVGAALAAGLIGALYAPLAFYQTTLQAAVPMTMLLSLVPIAMARAGEGRRVRSAVGIGAVIGAAALVRPVALVLVPAAFLAVLLHRRDTRLPRWRVRAAKVLAITLGTALLIAPQTAVNHSRGFPVLIGANGPLNLLIGHSHYADGRFHLNDAWREATGWRLRQQKSTFEQIRREIAFDPLRSLELQARKLGLLVTNAELSSVVRYRAQGLQLSPTLRFLSWNGRLGMTFISALGLVGLLMSVRRKEQRWLVRAVGGGVLLYACATALVFIEGRIRIPLVPLLLPFVGLAMRNIVAEFRTPRRWLPHLGIAAIFIALLLWAAETLPRKRYLDALPEGATPLSVPLGNGLEVVGFRLVSAHPYRDGYAFVNVIWRFDPSAAGADNGRPRHPTAWVCAMTPSVGKPFQPRTLTVGHQGYPVVAADDWPTGKLLEEGYFLRIPDGPGNSFELRIGPGMAGKKAPKTSHSIMTLSVTPRKEATAPR